MGRFMSATGQFLTATNGQFPRPPTGSYRCPLTEQLLNAVAYRNELVLQLVSRLLYVTVAPIERMETLVWGADTYVTDIHDIEALNAAILLRAGASWEMMAFHLGLSRQAVHRRLAAKGEELFEEAMAESDERTTDPEALISTFADAEELDRKGDDRGCDELLGTLGPRTQDQLDRLLVLRQSPDDILESPWSLTKEILDARREPPAWTWPFR